MIKLTGLPLFIPHVNQLEFPFVAVALVYFIFADGVYERREFFEAIIPGVEIGLFLSLIHI